MSLSKVEPLNLRCDQLSSATLSELGEEVLPNPGLMREVRVVWRKIDMCC